MKRRVLVISASCSAALWMLGVACQSTGDGVANTNDNSSSVAEVSLVDGVGFPTTGDALIIVESERGAAGSAVYFGVDDGETVKPTLLVADADDVNMIVAFDDNGDAIRSSLGLMELAYTYNDDGTFDMTLTDAGGNTYAESEIAPLSDETAARTPAQLSFADLIICEQSTIITETNAVLGRPMTTEELNCVSDPSQTALVVMVRKTCIIRDALLDRMEAIGAGCPQQPDPQQCQDRVQPWLDAQRKALERWQVGTRAVVRSMLARACSFDGLNNMLTPDSPNDTDGDGVAGLQDICHSTPAGEAVNALGCSISQLGAIDCADYLGSDTDCTQDGCCDPECLIDPDCTNHIICTRVQRCCPGDDLCDPGCPTDDEECSFCGEDGRCIEGCFPTEDPDCDAVANDNGSDGDTGSPNDNGGGDENDNGGDSLAGDPCIDTPTNWVNFLPKQPLVCFGDMADLVINRSGLFDVTDQAASVNFPITLNFSFSEFTSGNSQLDPGSATLDGMTITLTEDNFSTTTDPDDTLIVHDLDLCPATAPSDAEFIVRYNFTSTDGCGMVSDRVWSVTCCGQNNGILCGNSGCRE